MEVKKKESLDLLNFFYGMGAAVVITGAMFRFLNWDGASYMLGLGLVTEALVFAFSAFVWKKEEVVYKWDKLFPQLTRDGESRIEQLDDMLEKANLDPLIMERLTKSIEKLEQNIGKMNDISDTASLAENLIKMKQTSENFERELTRLNSSIAEMNNYYSKMLDVMGNKK